MKNKIAEIIRKTDGEVETDCIVLLPNEVDEAANKIDALYKQHIKEIGRELVKEVELEKTNTEAPYNIMYDLKIVGVKELMARLFKP